MPFRLTVVAAFAVFVPLAAQAAGSESLSTGGQGGQGSLGINEAIRAGEARRGTSLSSGPVGSLAPRSEYAKFPVYVGNVGDKQVRLRVGPKTDTRDSLQGEYASGDGKGGVRLLSGEWNEGAFLMEESDDGTRVSGNWEGRIDQSGAVSGTWTDAFNPAIVLPFFIRPLGGYLVIPPFDMRPSSGVTYAPPVPKSSISIGNSR
ncbi:hypothetical protein D3C87_1074140 [compost metagenome]|uniref:Uncharacterized protein n=1 Tax=Cupriavidus campinensis TaxID=151783 RepID=A0AAE9L3B3_9BURK|nr:MULTISPECIES: hypothetical protein [Cupriavidus]TSP14490.1 hypothetical protein FGG12_02210 [Cupriavidus campinensis]URF05411.1 hypothetical protein M5D45_06285 [Cupriavidus campinensis]CAG2144737.1 hypothetical protein LMG19282_02633 [Cupriavidus campinensis]